MGYSTQNQTDNKPIFLGSLLRENNALWYLKMTDCTVSKNLDGFCHGMLLYEFQKYDFKYVFGLQFSFTAEESEIHNFEMPSFGIR